MTILYGIIPFHADRYNGEAGWDFFGGIESGTNKMPGAGALGTLSYFILNSSHLIKPGDGFRSINRVFVNNLMEDFLCRELPVLRSTDAIRLGFLQNAQELPAFRKIQSVLAVTLQRT